MKKKTKIEEPVVITTKTLLNRDQKKNRNKIDGISESYAAAKRNEEAYKRSVQYQQEWAKQNYWVYGLPLNVNYEANLIYYLDSLESIKPYFADLIRKEMKNPYVDRKPNTREFIKGDDTKRRCFSLKFHKKKDKDIIDYLQSKESKRAYLIGLIEQDIIDKKFKFPKELKEYNKTNKVKKRHIKKEVYKITYEFIESKLAEGKRTFSFEELTNYTRQQYGKGLNNNSLAAYRMQLFGETGVLTSVPGASEYKISKREFNKLMSPEEFEKL